MSKEDYETDTENPKKNKKGFWGSLFRSRPTLPRRNSTGDGKLEKKTPPRKSSGNEELLTRRKRANTYDDPEPVFPRDPRRRPRRPDADVGKGKGKGKGRALNGHYGPRPLTEWPPSGLSSHEELTLGHAMELVCRGVPAHRGHKRPIPHASEAYYSLYASTAGNRGDETDAANLHNSMIQLMTLRTQGPGPAANPWDTLEQPSFSFYFGKQHGTITLNQYAGRSSVIPPYIALRDSGVVPRDVDLLAIFGRLRDLETGLEDDDELLMYKTLYRKFLKDPDKIISPHKTMDKQITDLIMVLSRPDWIDFTHPKNQIVTRFIFDIGPENHDQYHKFCHQLVLSMELELRIHSRHHNQWAKEKLLEQLPPTLRWNLALARRWREHVRIDALGRTADLIKLRYKLKRRQVKMIKRFAQMMKWPNLSETLSELRAQDADSSLDAVSSHAMAFFSGLVLPGPTFPFIMMNTLVDIDPDEATDDLALLTHLHPHCGFQYRNSYTYWTSTSIVGKVLAPTCHEIAGWVGPARPTSDLKRCQIARIRSHRPRQRLTPDDVESMSERSDPLGPPAEVFPVKEYVLLSPEVEDITDTVRVELFSLKTCPDKAGEPGPRWFDASIQFAIDGVSWPLRLTYDVSFISAWPCSDGPHPLFFDYTYLAVKADEVTGIRDWAGMWGSKSKVRIDERSTQSSPAGGSGAGSSKAAVVLPEPEDEEKVLVVEAFGVPDNEVLARAWCAHWGLSAVVADIGKTCMACAIREAYAATITVVILVEGRNGMDDE